MISIYLPHRMPVTTTLLVGNPYKRKTFICHCYFYVDFTIFTRSLTPVPLEKGNDRRVLKYGLRDVDPCAKIIVHNLAQQNVIWTRFHKWARKNSIMFWDAQYLTQASCLGHVGYSLRSPALSSRPILSNQEKTTSILSGLFRTDSGNRRKLDIAYNGPP